MGVAAVLEINGALLVHYRAQMCSITETRLQWRMP